jgi:hypothetical protein
MALTEIAALMKSLCVLELGQPMKLIDLKTRIAAILPDERNPNSLTWAEFLSVPFIVVVAVLAVVCAAVYWWGISPASTAG